MVDLLMVDTSMVVVSLVETADVLLVEMQEVILTIHAVTVADALPDLVG
jgi:hypothetical protein